MPSSANPDPTELSLERHTDVRELIQLEASGDDCLVGVGMRGFDTRIFGGSTLAQSVAAAATLASEGRQINSLQALFVSAGIADKPIKYRVTPLKNGRSFDIVDVVASQGDRDILVMRASFHGYESSREFQLEMPPVAHPETLERDGRSVPNTSPAIREAFDYRYPPGEDLLLTTDGGLREERVWVRTKDALDNDSPFEHAALLAYISDSFITRTAHYPLGGQGVATNGASLDHIIRFHRSFRIDEWLLFQSETLAYAGERSTSRMLIFSLTGDLVASVSQEILLKKS